MIVAGLPCANVHPPSQQLPRRDSTANPDERGHKGHVAAEMRFRGPGSAAPEPKAGCLCTGRKSAPRGMAAPPCLLPSDTKKAFDGNFQHVFKVRERHGDTANLDQYIVGGAELVRLAGPWHWLYQPPGVPSWLHCCFSCCRGVGRNPVRTHRTSAPSRRRRRGGPRPNPKTVASFSRSCRSASTMRTVLL